ncbi:MAG: putrescine ABC transporter ATP-binding subunit PotG [Succinivibrionaceae bacterium]|nr:putrescine ABC transporter ATP-binding subunit PotG [Succinivibrionaceae bacterium]
MDEQKPNLANAEPRGNTIENGDTSANQSKDARKTQNPNKPTVQEIQKRKPLVQIRKLTKIFDGGIKAVDDVDLTIYQGEIFALLGSSGCGKSTLLRMLDGLETPTSGEIIIDGQDLSKVPTYKRPVNMMFQSYALFPHMTVEQNIAFGLKQDKLPKSEISERVTQMLELVHMTDFRNRKPYQLSGGQRQRVALARSLAKRPKLLLLDEPMGALDKKLRMKMQLELVDIIEKVGVTCVMVTHDQEEAMTMAGRIAIMDKGELIQVGDPEEIYENPNCVFTAEFIGSVNLFHGELGENDSAHTVIDTTDLKHPFYINSGTNIADGMKVTVALRPEKIWIETEEPKDTRYNYAEGIVDNIAYMGDISIYHVKIASGKIVTVTIPNVDRFRNNQPSWDDKVYLHWEPDSAVVLTI